MQHNGSQMPCDEDSRLRDNATKQAEREVQLKAPRAGGGFWTRTYVPSWAAGVHHTGSRPSIMELLAGSSLLEVTCCMTQTWTWTVISTQTVGSCIVGWCANCALIFWFISLFFKGWPGDVLQILAMAGNYHPEEVKVLSFEIRKKKQKKKKYILLIPQIHLESKCSFINWWSQIL